MPDDLDIAALLAIADPAARRVLLVLLNRLEHLVAENRDQRGEIQRLRDEIGRLKEQHPAPERSCAPPLAREISSERERRKRRPRNRSKRPPVRIGRTVRLRLDRSQLPSDARPKGWVKTIVQDIVLIRRNTCFLREKLYPPSIGRTYLPEVPARYQGGFGPGTKTLALGLYHRAHMSFAQVKHFVRHAGLHISSGGVGALLTRGLDCFHSEKDEVLRAGLRSSSAHGIDTTPTGVAGKTWHADALCNPHYTVYHTTPTKERMAALAQPALAW